MSGYITRIEFHEADQKDYGKLLDEMKREFFTGRRINRVIKSDAILNPVEYIKEGPISLLDVNTATLRAAGRTGSPVQFVCPIIVTFIADC